VAVNTCHLGGSSIGGHPSLHRKFKENLSYLVRPCLKKTRARDVTQSTYVTCIGKALNFIPSMERKKEKVAK
jgi:hypothetical protein